MPPIIGRSEIDWESVLATLRSDPSVRFLVIGTGLYVTEVYMLDVARSTVSGPLQKVQITASTTGDFRVITDQRLN